MNQGSGSTAIVLAALAVLGTLVTVSPQLIKALLKWRESSRQDATRSPRSGGPPPVPVLVAQNWPSALAGPPPLPAPRTAPDAWYVTQGARRGNSWPDDPLAAPAPLPQQRAVATESAWYNAQPGAGP